MEFYADVVFLLNLMIDSVLLWLTATTRKLRVNWRRIGMSSFFGALYVVLSSIADYGLILTFFGKWFVALGMIAIAFGYVNLIGFLKNLGTFLLMNFSVAGGLLGFQYMHTPLQEITDEVWVSLDGEMITPFSIPDAGMMLFLMLVLLLCISWLYRDFAKRQKLSSYYAQVEVRISNLVVTCQGLIDTGNQLYDPLTRVPVMVMQASCWESHLPTEWKVSLSNPDYQIFSISLSESQYFWQERIRLIPFRAVNRDQAYLLAFKPDDVKISYANQVICTNKVLIAIDSGVLNNHGDYQAIIHPDLIQDELPQTQ